MAGRVSARAASAKLDRPGLQTLQTEDAAMLARSTLLTIIAIMTVAGLTPTVEPLPAEAQSGVACEVKAVRRGGATVVEGYVSAPAGFNGSYRISVSGGGGDTDQSGEFSGGGGKSSLGSVPVAGAGSFSAEIVIKQNGVSRCSSRAGGKV